LKKKNSKNKLIEFIALTKEDHVAYSPPVAANSLIPDWYKNQAMYIGSRTLDQHGNMPRTVKACMPAFDAMTAGYYILMPADVVFSNEQNGFKKTSWSTDVRSPIESHAVEQYDSFNVSDEYYRGAFKFINPWIIKTPPGYSTLITQPLFRDDLPFQILPGIVDTDKHPVAINFPFFIRKDFEGIIEYDTPIAQVIPFKRDDWTHTVSFDEDGTSEKMWQFAKKKTMNRYKTFFRSTKVWK